MSRVKVAVYGTLKKGFHNHLVLGDDAKYLGRGMTTSKYDMRNAGFPAILSNPDGKRVAVEVYDIPEDRLKDLDRLEGTPYMYTREKESILVFINMEEEEEVEDVFIYVGSPGYFGQNPIYPSLHDHYHEWTGVKDRYPKAGRFA